MPSQSRKLLERILRLLAIRTLRKYKPGVIGVTGSVGKTSTKEAVYAVLRNIRNVRASKGNFNNEIGLPLTILGDWEETGGAFFWLKVILISLVRLVIRLPYPEILVLEYAADRPSDIEYLTQIAEPNIGIVTAVGDIPVHVEFFDTPDAVAIEKGKLITKLSKKSFAVLNVDDERVFDMRTKTRGHVLLYGFGKNAHVRISAFEHRFEKKKPVGITFKLEYDGAFVPVHMKGVIGKGHAYAAAAAAAVGLSFGINLVRIAEILQYAAAPPHRLNIVMGIKNTIVIDDAYNASPASMQLALETVQSFPKGRRVGVLGDMLELGKYTALAHERAGKLAAKSLDVLVAVGDRSHFISEAAQKGGLAKKNIHSFQTAEEAIDTVEGIVKRGDYVLVKASRGVGLDGVVKKLTKG